MILNNSSRFTKKKISKSFGGNESGRGMLQIEDRKPECSQSPEAALRGVPGGEALIDRLNSRRAVAWLGKAG